ncbi:formate dehydrogenase accessory sulfurtransferase FdhD [Vibrio lentus]|nr:formate dehydrogenase accessory sulfurtransferase FdhD [Vibrio lentus]
MKTQRRNLAGTTGCGLCGVEALEQALPGFGSIAIVVTTQSTGFEVEGRIAEHQKAAKISGALHAALFANSKVKFYFVVKISAAITHWIN